MSIAEAAAMLVLKKASIAKVPVLSAAGLWKRVGVRVRVRVRVGVEVVVGLSMGFWVVV